MAAIAAHSFDVLKHKLFSRGSQSKHNSTIIRSVYLFREIRLNSGVGGLFVDTESSTNCHTKINQFQLNRLRKKIFFLFIVERTHHNDDAK